MPSFTVGITGCSTLIALVGGIVAVAVTCAASGGGGVCSSGGAGGGFAIAIATAIINAIIVGVLCNRVGSHLILISSDVRRMAELDIGLIQDYDDEADQTQPNAIDEVAKLEDARHAVHKMLADVAAFLPPAIFRRIEGKDADGKSIPIDLQSATTIGKVSTHQSSNSTSNSLAQVRQAQFSTSMMHRRITVLCVNIRSFRHMFGEGSIIDDVLQTLADYIAEVEQVAREHRGCIDQFHGDHVTVSFNAFSAVTQHTRRAVQCALSITHKLSNLVPEDDDHDGSTPTRRVEVSCGISTGNAFVGNVGSLTMRRPAIIGTVFTQAIVLQRLAKLYFPSPKRSGPAGGGDSPAVLDLGRSPKSATAAAAGPVEQVVVQHHVAIDCENDFTCQALDLLTLPGMNKRHLVWAVHSSGHFEEYKAKQEAATSKGRRHTVVEETEWMYFTQTARQQNPFLNLNCGLEEVLEGSPATAREFLAKHVKAVADGAFPPSTALLASIGESNLANAVSAELDRPYERDLGVYYNWSVK